MRLFVITTGTKDYGGMYVVREHRGTAFAEAPLAVVPLLEEARGAIEEFSPSLVRLPRCDLDDPVIVESWGNREDVDALLELQNAMAPMKKSRVFR